MAAGTVHILPRWGGGNERLSSCTRLKPGLCVLQAARPGLVRSPGPSLLAPTPSGELRVGTKPE